MGYQDCSLKWLPEDMSYYSDDTWAAYIRIAMDYGIE